MPAPPEAQMQVVLAALTAVYISDGGEVAGLDSLRMRQADAQQGLSIFAAAELCWASEPGRTYQVQWTGSLSSLIWADLGVPRLATAAETCVFDSTRGHAKRFYRVSGLR